MSAIYRFLALDKVKRIFDIIKHNGGVLSSVEILFRTDELKIGELIGVDKFGNKYFQNNMYFFGRNRWVVYSKSVNLDYDASQVPAEWHRWLHYITDDPPTLKPPVNYKWLTSHTENLSGTKDAYVPYSTTLPKIQSWIPPQRKTEA